MSSRKQRSIPLGGRYRQVSLYSPLNPIDPYKVCCILKILFILKFHINIKELRLRRSLDLKLINDTEYGVSCKNSLVENAESYQEYAVTVSGAFGVTPWAFCQICKIACYACAGTFSPPSQIRDPYMHHGACVTHVPWCMPESLTCVLLWSRWRGKRSRCMRNPQIYASGKRPITVSSSRVTQLLLKWQNRVIFKWCMNVYSGC